MPPFPKLKNSIKKLIIFLVLFVISFLLYDTYKYKFYNTENSISILTYNCGNEGKQQPTLEQIAGVINYAGKPDIVFLQDIAWQVKIPDLCKLLNYPHYVTARKKPTPLANLAILSKYPLSDDEKLIVNQDGQSGNGVLNAITTINQAKILLCCVKLSSLSKQITNTDNSLSWSKLYKVLVKEVFYESLHTKDVKKIIAYIKNKRIKNVIIGGDFNTISFSKPIRLITKHYKDSFQYSIKYFMGTKIKYFIKPRIDYIFASTNFILIKRWIIEKTYGDHYPVFSKMTTIK